MNTQIVSQNNGNAIGAMAGQPLTMSSQEIADLVGSRHDSVKRTIERLSEKGLISFTPSVATSHDGAGSRPVEIYLVNKRDSYIIVAQLSPEFTASLVDRWQELEAGVIPKTLSSALRLAADQAEQIERLAIERDHAVATKAQIGSKREATAMATASAAKRQADKLRELIGEAAKSASILAVEGKTKLKFEWRPLRDYCNAVELEMGKSFNPGIQREVKTYPAKAWLDVYGVNLAGLFGGTSK